VVPTRIRVSFTLVYICANVGLEVETTVTVAGVVTRMVYTVSMSTESRYLITLVNIGTGLIVAVKVVADITATLPRPRLIDTDLVTESVLLATLIPVMAHFTVLSKIVPRRTFTYRRSHRVGAIVRTSKANRTFINILTLKRIICHLKPG
jgi:hypothetical protein